jgi:predicted AAA+ superfamily ATPase
MASFELKVTLQEDYPSYVTVGLEGLGDDIEVYKDEYRNNFPNNPSTHLTIEEGDYTVKFYALVDGKKYYEVDFLITEKHKISPIEVKSSGYKTHKSLDEFSTKFSDRITNKYVIYTKDYKRENGVEYIPVYMTMFL